MTFLVLQEKVPKSAKSYNYNQFVAGSNVHGYVLCTLLNIGTILLVQAVDFINSNK